MAKKFTLENTTVTTLNTAVKDNHRLLQYQLLKQSKDNN